jgi:hypothetical protein
MSARAPIGPVPWVVLAKIQTHASDGDGGGAGDGDGDGDIKTRSPAARLLQKKLNTVVIAIDCSRAHALTPSSACAAGASVRAFFAGRFLL